LDHFFGEEVVIFKQPVEDLKRPEMLPLEEKVREDFFRITPFHFFLHQFCAKAGLNNRQIRQHRIPVKVEIDSQRCFQRQRRLHLLNILWQREILPAPFDHFQVRFLCGVKERFEEFGSELLTIEHTGPQDF
jgi:hypothetical protein